MLEPNALHDAAAMAELKDLICELAVLEPNALHDAAAMAELRGLICELAVLEPNALHDKGVYQCTGESAVGLRYSREQNVSPSHTAQRRGHERDGRSKDVATGCADAWRSLPPTAAFRAPSLSLGVACARRSKSRGRQLRNLI